MARPVLAVNNLSKTFGRQSVLNDVSFQVAEGQKIALIGRNGAGKSTLLKILTGEIQADSGNVETYDWTRIGVVKQNEVLPGDSSVLDYLQDNSGKPDWTVKKMAARFGLRDHILEQAPAELSGGYQMRVKLTALFLEEPNLLYLDEPVNYLDLQTLLLLETVLQEYRGAFILVAHDRTFLEHTCDMVFEIERSALTTYNGSVSDFLAWKEEQIQFQRRTNKKLAKEAKHHQKFVDRFGAKASLASRAQSKVKHIAKLRSKIVKIDADLAKTKIKIQAPMVHDGEAVHVKNLSIGYDGTAICSDINFRIQRGEKVVLVGENGRGKSTLLKTLVGTIPALGGLIKWWKHADIGYYDQLTSTSLNDSDTVLAHLTACAPANTSAQQILMMAGNFLFKGDDLDKQVRVLSGGERARLALAGVLLHEHTVLILDEPTNHMDVETTEALSVALKNYTGTVIFVSHSRTFVHELAGRIFDVRGGTIKEYIGTYSDYVQFTSDLMAAESEIENAAPDKTAQKERYAAVKEIQRHIQKIDKDMKSLDTEKSAILKYYFEHPMDYAPEKAQRMQEIDAEMESLEREWMRLQVELEKMRN